MKNTPQPRGMTTVELLIGTALLLVIGGIFAMGIRWSRHSGATLEKTDLTAKLRNCSVVLAKQLYLANEFLYPSDASDDEVNQIVFKNNRNEILTIFLNEEGKVCLYNYTTGYFKEIVPYTIEFKGRLVDKGLIHYLIEIEKDEYRFTLQNELSTCNTLP